MAIAESEYKTVAGMEHGATYNGKGDFAFRIQVRINRELTEGEKSALYDARELLDQAFVKGNHEVDPEVHLKAMKDRADILACFDTNLIYVEEIPNGYCSRGCCAFYPWFIVTTPIGRIKIGWRKRVIHLEWTNSLVKLTADELFVGDMTKYDCVIHAWGYEKAKEFIKKLFEVT
jgi:hypothetical protein